MTEIMDRTIGSLLIIGALLSILACFAIPVGIVFLMIKFAPVWAPAVDTFIETHTWAKVLLISAAVGNGVILVNMFLNWFIYWVRETA